MQPLSSCMLFLISNTWTKERPVSGNHSALGSHHSARTKEIALPLLFAKYWLAGEACQCQTERSAAMAITSKLRQIDEFELRTDRLEVPAPCKNRQFLPSTSFRLYPVIVQNWGLAYTIGISAVLQISQCCRKFDSQVRKG